MALNLIPFAADTLPSYINPDADAPEINKDVSSFAVFPVLSIKGKRFTVVRDGVKQLLTRPVAGEPGEFEPAQNVGLVMLRANMKAKEYFSKKYAEGESEGQRPDCYSVDGIAPSPLSPAVQSTKCGICPHNVWGSRQRDDGTDDGTEKKGRACPDKARIAFSAPDKFEPLLVRVPPDSLKNLREAVKLINQRKIPYNAVVLKVGFDYEAAHPKLTFKPVGLLSEEGYNESKELYDSEIVRAITGVDDIAPPPAPDHETNPPVSADELDAAIQARAATQKAQAPQNSNVNNKPAQVAPPVKPAPVAPAPAKPAPAKPATPAARATSEPAGDELEGMEGMFAAPGTEAPAPAAEQAPTVATKRIRKVAPADVQDVQPKPAASNATGADNLLGDIDDLLGNIDD